LYTLNTLCCHPKHYVTDVLHLGYIKPAHLVHIEHIVLPSQTLSPTRFTSATSNQHILYTLNTLCCHPKHYVTDALHLGYIKPAHLVHIEHIVLPSQTLCHRRASPRLYATSTSCTRTADVKYVDDTNTN